MTRTRRTAISYSRFSDPKQAAGDSEDRQDQDFRAFCARHDLTPLPEVYADRGRSGYKDEHRKKGRLGELIAAAKDGRFEPGTVIVIEAWDRLGRLRPDRQTELVAELLRTGVDIGVCRLDDVFTEDDFGSHKWTGLAVFIQLAYQESKQKAERVAASWERRRKRARSEGRLLTSRLPAWLEYVNGEARPIPERAAAVKRIFQLAANGCGHKRIVATLEAEGIPAFGEAVVRKGRRRSQFSGKWTRPYVALILNDRRAVGELQPKKADGTAEGKPLAGYYPAAVTEEEFLLARAGQQARQSGLKERASRQRRHVNVFRGMLRHVRDGEGFMLHAGGTRERPTLLLRNQRGADGRGRNYTFPYPVFEEAVLGLLREVDPRDVLPGEGEEASRADVLRAKLANVREDLAALKEELRQGFSKTLAALLREKESEEGRVAADLQGELARAARPLARTWEELPGLVDLIHRAKDPDEVRLRLRTVLARVVSEAWVLVVRRGSYQLCLTQFHFDGGARRDYLIAYRTGGHSWPSGWYAASVRTGDTEAFGVPDMREEHDLRDPEVAARVQAQLENVPKAGLEGMLKEAAAYREMEDAEKRKGRPGQAAG
jgi:DNA invertase Pin-like site-specific DNA recombinase